MLGDPQDHSEDPPVEEQNPPSPEKTGPKSPKPSAQLPPLKRTSLRLVILSGEQSPLAVEAYCLEDLVSAKQVTVYVEALIAPKTAVLLSWDKAQPIIGVVLESRASPNRGQVISAHVKPYTARIGIKGR